LGILLQNTHIPPVNLLGERHCRQVKEFFDEQSVQLEITLPQSEHLKREFRKKPSAQEVHLKLLLLYSQVRQLVSLVLHDKQLDPI
jgi:hypothetical protein